MSSAYNQAPTQQAPIIRQREDSEDLELIMAMWGLVPGWWKKPLSEKKFSTFNAKSEEAAGQSITPSRRQSMLRTAFQGIIRDALDPEMPSRFLLTLMVLFGLSGPASVLLRQKQ